MPFAMPVSYHQEVAPIFAFHCSGCHGEAGGLSLRSYEQLLEGGNKGKVIIAGDADNSLLMLFIEGRRGEAHRMPAGGKPLPAKQISTLRRWINEGAHTDALPPTRKYQLTNVEMEKGKVTRITCRVPVQAYLVLTAIDPETKKLLWTETASVKKPKEQNDAGEPGDELHWDVSQAPDWPKVVTLQLTIHYMQAQEVNVEFSATKY